MGLWYSLKQAASGNFENAFNGMFSSDDLLAAQDQVGDNLSRRVAEQQAAGLISETEALNRLTLLAPNSNSSAYWEASEGGTPLDVFNKTLVEEAANIGQLGSSAINRTLGLGFRVIPWQVWVAVLILAMVWAYPFWKPFASAFLARGRK